MRMRKPLLIDEYLESLIGANPLKEYMKSFLRRLENQMMGASRWKCSYCGENERGYSDVMTGMFKCFKCIFREEYDRVENDPDMIRKVRVWNLRAAREKRLIQEEWKNNFINPPITDEEIRMQSTNLTQEQREEVARKLMSTLDMPVNGP